MSISFTFSYNGIIVPLHSTSHPVLLPFPYLIEYAGFFLVLYWKEKVIIRISESKELYAFIIPLRYILK